MMVDFSSETIEDRRQWKRIKFQKKQYLHHHYVSLRFHSQCHFCSEMKNKTFSDKGKL